MGDSGIMDLGKRRALFEDLIANGPDAANPKAGILVQQMMKHQGVTAGPMLQVLAQQRATSVEQLQRLATPTLLVCGLQDNDNGSPEGLAAILPQAKVLRVPGDHLSAVRTAELREAFCSELIR
jgi:hypothetical protein